MTTLPAADIARVAWIRAMRGHELRIHLADGKLYKFDGLPGEAQEELADFCREHYKIPLEVRELNVKGWNWGQSEFDGSHLEFKVGERLAFDLPLSRVTNAVVSTKDEVAIEFAQPESVDKKTDTLVELRLYVPTATQDRDGDRDNNDDNDDNDASDDGQVKLDAAKSLCEKIKGFSELNQVTGETIVSIPDLPCLVPRGRFELDMAATHLRLHGKSYDHKILYSSIVKLFLLPKPDDLHVLFVMALDPPIRQGQTRYPFLVFQFNKDDHIDVDLQNVDEETLKTKYEGKLQLHYEAPTFEVVSTLFRLLAAQKIIVPGSFRGSTDSNSFKCAFKANEGFLYPLERNFLFLPKPVTLIPHADIAHVEFARIGPGLANPRSFDVKFFLKSGQDISFSNIAKEEHLSLEGFLRAKNIEFRSKEEEIRRKRPATDGSVDDDEADGNGEDEGSSPDEDYAEDESEEESSVDEEYDEEYESGDDDDDDASEGGSGDD